MPSGQAKTEYAKSRVGQTIGNLRVLEHLGSNATRKAMYKCLCVCGKEAVKTWPFKGTQSCGCIANKSRAQTHLKHGHSRRNNNGGTSKLNYVWRAMRARCNNPNNKNYALYGGRGIRVCAAWDDFNQFIEDVGIPEDGMTLDRIDTDKDYSKENVRWVPQQVNCQNKRNNVLNPDKVKRIKSLASEGKAQKEIALLVGAPDMAIWHVLSGKTWTNIA